MVVVTGPANATATWALIAVALAAPDPAICLLRAPNAEDVPPSHPAHSKTAANGSAAYNCRAGKCGLPLSDTQGLAAALRQRPIEQIR